MDSHERVDAHVAEREGETERAQVRGAVRQEVVDVQHRQEDDSVAHAVNAAYLWAPYHGRRRSRSGADDCRAGQRGRDGRI